MLSIFTSMLTPLRTRLIIGMGIMLLPLAVLGVGGFNFLQSVVQDFEEVVQEMTTEIDSVVQLQSLIQRAGMVVHDNAFRDDPRGREIFVSLRREVDKAFEEARAQPLDLAAERTLVQAAQEEWERAHDIAEAMLVFPRSPENPAIAQEMERFDTHIGRATDNLFLVQNLARSEIMADLAKANAAKTRALLLIGGAFLTGLGIAIVAGIRLARSIILPVRVLEEGASRFGEGDLSYRVALATNDELGQLARTFNAMAERLQKSRDELESLAIHDGLTGLYNRLEFHRRLTEEVERSQRYGRSLSLLILDIDQFKTINDTYGHLAGDEVLRSISAMLNVEARAVDKVARLGGDEMAVILPDTPGPNAFRVAERIRSVVASQAITVAPGQEVKSTVSIGLASFPADARLPDDLIAKADQALYAAKAAGRNQVVSLKKS